MKTKYKKQQNSSIKNDADLHELRKHFRSHSDSEHIMRHLQTFKNEAKIFQDVQPGPFFASKVLNRWKAQPQTNSNFWSSFDFVPRIVIETVYVASILLMIMVFYSHHEFQTMTSEAQVQVDETYILQNDIATPTITTPDQALQYALNLNPDN